MPRSRPRSRSEIMAATARRSGAPPNAPRSRSPLHAACWSQLREPSPTSAFPGGSATEAASSCMPRGAHIMARIGLTRKSGVCSARITRPCQASVLFDAVEALLDEQGSQLHGLDAETVGVGVEALQSATTERHDAPLGPGRIRRSPAVGRDTQTMCKLRRNLRGSEISRAGSDTALSLGTEAACKLVEVQLRLGHR